MFTFPYLVLTLFVGIAIGVGVTAAYYELFAKSKSAPGQNGVDERPIPASNLSLEDLERSLKTTVVENADDLEKAVRELGPQSIEHGTRALEVAQASAPITSAGLESPYIKDAHAGTFERFTADELQAQAEERAQRMLEESQNPPDPHEQFVDPASALLSPQPVSTKKRYEPPEPPNNNDPLNAPSPKGRKSRSLIHR